MARLTDNALHVLERRYLLRDERGAVVETPGALFRRVARAVAAAEPPAERDRAAERFEARMSALEFLPNSPTLMNAGRAHGQLAACFVLPVEDDLAAIFDALKWAALIHQSGGGTGFAFSRLRPRGDVVKTTHGVASGPVSFMRVYDAATEIIKQGGVRRGANMAVLSAEHPDILEFVDAKRSHGLENFNLSVAAPDALFRAASRGDPWPLRHPRGGIVRNIDPRALLARIADSAWASGEPGLVFLDRVEAANPTPDLGHFEAVNPCGEQPLLPFEACTLGSVNLACFERSGRVDWDGLGACVRDGVRFLDDVLDVNVWPLPQIAEISHRNRKVGLGVMGWADLLVRLGIPYDSPDALAKADEVMGFVTREAHAASEALARERGAFPGFPTSALAHAGRPRRNATVTTIAPTGTLALIAGCSSGIEPLFALAYVRRALDDSELREEHPLVAEALRAAGADAALAAVRAAGRARGVPGVPPAVARLFATAHDVAPEAHVRMQAAFQRHTDNGVSKTINLPRSAAVDDVARAYALAYELGCKGITVYRDGSRERQVLTSGATRNGEECPQCASPLSRTGGCMTCARCGWASCETTE
ncbi:adenosylcobalamin-dependent ribonucleoside-diphosphate reductase [Anaeromyxobacter sp. Fw109-5]|uniref:adenosylcobalamin-dependent ribonucleoside-diphosphate reductase n=1 Tax=Anaeromyxobacter sp. (strain Fw109-5) TaxID=404589 RepID=UPI0000ED7CE9|nr:adenosylcobalamin-dependent ribonucleoside-diphosphate reductase [Anaeromyxobacter sp. Fw109-5]ABS25591.1 ribonucleoside-diphosphate reductase, adenosylcobalamin-dependent [Anaeromyxobacter sp. Fw109-5]